MASNLLFHLTGGAANANPDLSLGGVGSSEVLSATALNNLFDNVDPTETAAGAFGEYRAIDLSNDGDALARNVEFYFTDTTNVESIVAVWYDSTGTQSIGDEGTEPTGASGNWTTPLVGTKLALGNLAIAATHRLWIRRIVDHNADNINDDTAIIHSWFS